MYTSSFPGLFAAVISQMKIQRGYALEEGFTVLVKLSFAHFDNRHLGLTPLQNAAWYWPVVFLTTTLATMGDSLKSTSLTNI